jgi:hypothetical protein
MTRVLLYLTTGLLISCTQQHNSTQTVDTVQTVQKTINEDRIANINAESGEDDCVFNNDYKGLTSGWLGELKIENFIWRDDLKQALVPNGQDTVFLSRGGCSHSGLSVELKLASDNHSITDSTYWITKALNLATEYQMDYYEQMIKERRIKKAESGPTSVWYEVEDNDLEDNLIYDGIEIIDDGQNKRISISQYFN